MRRLKTSIILALCTTVAGFSADRQPQQKAPPMFRTATANSEVTKRRKRRRKRPGIPLVDSNLLRFLNTQKLARQQQPQLLQTNRSEEEIDEDSLVSATTLLDPIAKEPETERIRKDSSSIRNGNETVVSSSSAVSSLAGQTKATTATAESSPSTVSTSMGDGASQQSVDDDDDDVTTLWLSQYNSHRVRALLLDRCGSDEDRSTVAEAAAKAGEKVQSQALARTARRRVREFLKQREVDWSSSTASSTTSSTSNSPNGSGNKDVSATTLTTSAASDLIETQNDSKGLGSEAKAATGRSNLNNLEEIVDLMLEYGLKVKDVAEILIHTPGIALMQARVATAVNGEDKEKATTITSGAVSEDASVDTTATSTAPTTGQEGETLQQTLDRVLVDLLCGSLKLRRYDARKVLRQTPSLLTRRGSKSAHNVLQLFQQLGVSNISLSRDKNALPTLLCRSPAAIFRLVAFLSSDAVRMPVHKIGPLLRRPESRQLLNTVAPPVPDRRRRDDDDDDALYSVLYGRSKQLRRDHINEIYRNMTETAWTLRHEIGTADLGKVIAAYPSVLLLDAQEQILPTAEYLMDELGIWQDDLPRVLQLYPVLLGKPVSQMQRVAAYLQSIEVPPESLSSIFRSFPVLLTMNLESQVMPVVHFLKTKIGISNVGRFVSRLPPVLGYSVQEELQPKWDYLQTVTTDPRFAVSRFPAYFSYPLERVTKTRFEYLKHVKRIPTTLVPLDQVVRYGDRDFSLKVARDQDDGVAFGKFVAQRRPSSRGNKKRQRRGNNSNKNKQPRGPKRPQQRTKG